MIIVVTFLSGLIVVIIPVYGRALNAARVTRAIGEIRQMEKDIAAYKDANKVLPNNLTAIGWGDSRDPWNNEYVYVNFSIARPTGARKDRFLAPLNTTYDLYSKGRDGTSKLPLTAAVSHDDVVRGSDGAFIGLGINY